MNRKELEIVASRILARSDRIVYAKRDMNGELHQIVYAEADDTAVYFEHFINEEECNIVWEKIIRGLAGNPRPKCALFCSIALISPQYIVDEPWLTENETGYFLNIEFRTDNCLSFSYADKTKREENFQALRTFLGLDQKGARVLN